MMIEVRPDIATKSGRRMRRLVRGNFPGGGNSGILESWGSDCLESGCQFPAVPYPGSFNLICGAVSLFYKVTLRPINEQRGSSSSDLIAVRFPPPPRLFLIWGKAVVHASFTWTSNAQHGTGYASNRVSRAKRHTGVDSPPPDSR